MRKYTLIFSIAAHAAVVAALIVAPALATHDLPEPRRTTAFIIVRPQAPPPVPIATRRDVAASVPTPAPLTPPEGIVPEPVREPIDLPNVGPVPLSFGTAVGDAVSTGDVVAPPPIVPRAKPPVRVGGVIQAPTKLVNVAPIYPSIALAARKEGLVILEAVIDEDGAVREVRSLRPEPLFEDAAMTAVRQWRFSPTRLNGDAVPVVMTVTVSFTLNR
jgi:protein TonB